MTETKKTEVAEVAPKQRSYFAKEVVNRFILDDGESFIEHQKLDEGLFQQYQDLTSKISLDREGQNTTVDMALGRQRKFLLENLVTNWNLVDESNKPIKYTSQRLFELSPHIISDLVQDIYEKNEILNISDDEEGKGESS